MPTSFSRLMENMQTQEVCQGMIGSARGGTSMAFDVKKPLLIGMNMWLQIPYGCHIMSPYGCHTWCELLDAFSHRITTCLSGADLSGSVWHKSSAPPHFYPHNDPEVSQTDKEWVTQQASWVSVDLNPGLTGPSLTRQPLLWLIYAYTTLRMPWHFGSNFGPLPTFYLALKEICIINRGLAKLLFVVTAGTFLATHPSVLLTSWFQSICGVKPVCTLESDVEPPRSLLTFLDTWDIQSLIKNCSLSDRFFSVENVREVRLFFTHCQLH